MKKFLFLFMILFVGLNVVSADGNTLEDVANKMKETPVYQLFNDEEDPIVIKTAPDRLVVTTTSEIDKEIYKYDFANDVISWNFKGDRNNSSDISSVLFDEFWIVDIIYAVGLLNGYTEEQMDFWLDSDNENKFDNLTLEENGIEITSYSFKFEEENSTFSGSMIDTFKIDINKFDVGEIEVSEDVVIEKDVPILEVLEVSDISVKFRISSNSEDIENKYCYLYRTDIEDYNKAESVYITGGNCNSEIIDEEVEPGKTYYYRALIEEDDNSYGTPAFSNVEKITTKEKINNVPSSSSNNVNNYVDKNGNINENPKTGVNFIVISIIMLMIFSLMWSITYIKEYSDLK